MTIWNLKQLFEAPTYKLTDLLKRPGVKGIFYDSLPYQGKPTKVFAWIGMPKVKKSQKVPGIILVHGGQGTAFHHWVTLWNSRGYAAIAMDTCGGIPDKYDPKKQRWTRHRFSGPKGWGQFELADRPPEDQWIWHATASVILAHSLLRSFDAVDASKIGITGVSWGGILTCIVAGLDNRLAFAAPVYGCGFLKGDSRWNDKLNRAKKYDAWLKRWDPALYLPQARIPFLWLNGTNDITFPLEATMKSYAETKGEKRLCLRVRMHHSHGPVSENPPEILDFAEAVTKKQKLPPRLKTGTRKGLAMVVYDGSRKIVKAELNYTRAAGYWTDRTWNTLPAEVTPKNRTASIQLPYATTAFFFNLYDDKGLIYSSEIKTIEYRISAR